MRSASMCCCRHQPRRRQPPQRQKIRQQERHHRLQRRQLNVTTFLAVYVSVLTITLLLWTVIHLKNITTTMLISKATLITTTTETTKPNFEMPSLIATTTTTTPSAVVEQRRQHQRPMPSPSPSPTRSRKKNFLTTTSGCRIARWVYPTGTIRKRFRDCSQYTYNDGVEVQLSASASASLLSKPRLLLSNSNSNTTTVGIQPYDTIYVTIQKLALFVETILPILNVDIVLLSGQIYKLPTKIPTQIVHQILNHPHILHWFCQNLDTNIVVDFGVTTTRSRHGNSTKLSPFPYGLKEVVHKHDMTRQQESFNAYNQIYDEVSKVDEEGEGVGHGDEHRRRPRGGIYWGPISGTTKFREGLPGFIVSKTIPAAAKESSRPVYPSSSSLILSPLEFYRSVSKHQFVVSPVGDRTETYRHYEALGLGTIPIILTDGSTSTSPSSYISSREGLRHLEPGPVLIINVTAALLDEYNRNWTNLVEDHVETFLSHSKKSQQLHHLRVNREMVLESYWIQHIEDVVGHQLHWSDRIL